MIKDKEKKLAEIFPFLSKDLLDKIQTYVETKVKDAKIEVLTSDAQRERIRVKSGSRELYRELI